MTGFKLSTKEDWENHWRRHDLVRLIPADFAYHGLLKRAAASVRPSATSIELGGFPGSFSVYLTKYCGIRATLLDYNVDRTIVDALLKANGLPAHSIRVIQADVFSHSAIETYDIVCSFGFIEHFSDLSLVLNQHLKFLSPGGTLVMSLPNFRGLNGMVQRIFDPANLALHNLAVMDPHVLETALSALGMTDVHVEYSPSTQVWLEGLRGRALPVRLLMRILNRASLRFARWLGAQSRWLSNGIEIFAKRPLEPRP